LASGTRHDQIADAKFIDGDFLIRRRDAGSREEATVRVSKGVALVRLIT
jgi:hypothetical protein